MTRTGMLRLTPAQLRQRKEADRAMELSLSHRMGREEELRVARALGSTRGTLRRRTLVMQNPEAARRLAELERNARTPAGALLDGRQHKQFPEVRHERS